MKKTIKPFLLVIIDGWGVRKAKEGNAIVQANTPVMDLLMKNYPNTILGASGRDVGLPAAQTGNSEAGHMNIGAGRIVEQDSVRVSRCISDGSFFKNRALLDVVEHVKKYKSDVHLMGLLTDDQSPHADPDHLLGLITLFNLTLEHVSSSIKVYLHLFTDGRDSYQYSATKLLDRFKPALSKRNQIASICGRFYAMDRIKQWSRTERAYNALVMGEGFEAKSAEEAVMQAYNRNENDEYIQPTVIKNNHDKGGRISNNDAVIFFNVRSDRVRQLAKAFVQKKFVGFKRKKVLKNLRFVSMTSFGPDLPSIVEVYPTLQPLKNTVPFVMKDYRQLYVAETEKYAHVTYFFNGGYDHPVAGEDRIIIKSPVAYTYRTKPEMRAKELTDIVCDSIEYQKHDFMVMNFANPDMVGHTGDFPACIRAVEWVDTQIGRLAESILKHDGTMMVTADHGNADEKFDVETEQIITSHSKSPVPFIIVNKKIPKNTKVARGVLGDIAPTMLHMLGMPCPPEMSEHILCKYRIVP